MEFKEQEIIEAFNIFSKLTVKGHEDSDDLRLYTTNDKVRELVDRFAHEVDCTIILAGDYIYLVPIATTSPLDKWLESVNTYLEEN